MIIGYELLRIAGFVGSTVWKFLPIFLLSIVLSVMVHKLNMDKAIRGALNARIGFAILLAALVGAFSPFCSCTVVPIVSGLLMGGVPLAPVMAFWVASPTMDPEIFALSVGMLGWPLAVIRLIATLGLSIGAGYITLVVTRSGLITSVLKQAPVSDCGETCSVNTVPTSLISLSTIDTMPQEHRKPLFDTSLGIVAGAGHRPPPAWFIDLTDGLRGLNWREVARDVLKESWNLGRWLLIAFVLEAVITFYVPQESIAALLGGEGLFSVLLATLIGVPLYLNNIGALPIVSGLLAQGMQPGAAIAFLIAGPLTTLPAMTAVWGIASKRVFVLYISIAVLGAVLLGYITNLLLWGVM